MKKKTMDFEDRFELAGARFLTRDGNTCYSTYGYKLVKGQRDSYMTGTKERNATKYSNYMLQVTSIWTENGVRDVVTQDVVDYRLKESNERRAGVIVYDKEQFLFAVQDTMTSEMHPLYTCKLVDVLGCMYEHEEFLSMQLPAIYKKLGRPMPTEEKKEDQEDKNEQDIEYAYVDEPIPGLTDATDNTATGKIVEPSQAAPKDAEKPKASDLPPTPPAVDYLHVYAKVLPKANGLPEWVFELSYKGKKGQKKGQFHKQGTSAYYEVAALAIALSQINGRRTLCLHVESTILFNLLEGKDLEAWANNNWQKPNGIPVKNAAALQALKTELDRVAISYQVIFEPGKTSSNSVAC